MAEQQQLSEDDELARLKRLVAVLIAERWFLPVESDLQFRAIREAAKADAEALLADVKASASTNSN